jgi:hypothetical protein
MDLYTLKDIADFYGVTKQYMNKLKNEDDNFPEPALKKGRVHLYTKEQVLAFGETRDFDNPHTNRKKRLEREEREVESK